MLSFVVYAFRVVNLRKKNMVVNIVVLQRFILLETIVMVRILTCLDAR